MIDNLNDDPMMTDCHHPNIVVEDSKQSAEIPSQKSNNQQQQHLLTLIRQHDRCTRKECHERESYIDEQAKQIEELKAEIDRLKLKNMGKKGIIKILEMQNEMLNGQILSGHQGKFIQKSPAAAPANQEQYEMKGRRANMHNSIDSNDGVITMDEEIVPV